MKQFGALAALSMATPWTACAQTAPAAPQTVTTDQTEDTLAPAQVTDGWRPPTLTIERYTEDWSRLADPTSGTGRWTEPFKYIPLDRSGEVYLTTGVELRERFEGIGGNNWGSAADQGYLWSRLMPFADLHVGHVRFFAQPIVAYATGVKPGPGPVDQTGVDLLQGFVDVSQELGPGTTVRVEVGRQLFGLGTERLVGTRYGPNVPLAFDGVRAILHHDRERVILLYERPVETRPGNFNDHTSRDEALWGAYATHWFDDARSSGVDLYYLGFRNDAARVEQRSGREVRESFGTRWFGTASAWHWNVEGVLQTGRLADRKVLAWTLAGEVGKSFPEMPLTPDLTLRADVASGDRSGTKTLEGFNPLFPKGKYFGELSPIGPRNVVDVHPAATFNLIPGLSLGVAAMAYWRQSKGDGVYDTPGHLLRVGTPSEARFIGKEAEIAVQWQATPELSLETSLSAFLPGAFVRETGPNRAIRMVGLEANFRY